MFALDWLHVASRWRLQHTCHPDGNIHQECLDKRVQHFRKAICLPLLFSDRLVGLLVPDWDHTAAAPLKASTNCSSMFLSSGRSEPTSCAPLQRASVCGSRVGPP